ncbi:MAG: carbamoyltransferase [Pseudohongiellaceae bacterium]|jgi:carbamoyltransferase
MHILGISAFHGPSAAALLSDGVPVATLQEERLTRKRHDTAFPSRAIRFCLNQAGLESRELDYVVFYERPLRRFERVLLTQIRAFPRSGKTFSRSMFQWLGDRLWIKGRITDELGISPDKIRFVEHQASLASTAFLTSPHDEAAVLIVSDEGEWATTSLGRGHDGQVTMIEELAFPHSLGLLVSAVTQFLGLESGRGGEGRVMELAAHGQPRFLELFEKWLKINPDGSFEIDPSPFRFAFYSELLFGDGLVEALGPARSSSASLRMSADDSRDADVAASLQLILENALLGLVRRLADKVPSKHLCLGGEVAKNSAAVGRLLRDGPFASVFVPAAPGDDGAALGAAITLQHSLAGESKSGGADVPTPYDKPWLGESILEDPGNESMALADDDAIVEALLGHLLNRRTVGWMRGRSESASHSLGHRSLLADPRKATAAEHMRSKVKTREGFRSFHPAVLSDRVEEFFELPAGGMAAARGLRISVPVTERTREVAPAVVHVDGTARPLPVEAERDPLFHRLLARFSEETGCPMLLHTSLNGRGEPMVRTEVEARDLFERTALDALVVEGRLYE